MAVREAEVSFFAVQVDWTDLGQVFTAGIQIVFVLQKKKKIRISNTQR